MGPAGSVSPSHEKGGLEGKSSKLQKSREDFMAGRASSNLVESTRSPKIDARPREHPQAVIARGLREVFKTKIEDSEESQASQKFERAIVEHLGGYLFQTPKPEEKLDALVREATNQLTEGADGLTPARRATFMDAVFRLCARYTIEANPHDTPETLVDKSYGHFAQIAIDQIQGHKNGLTMAQKGPAARIESFNKSPMRIFASATGIVTKEPYEVTMAKESVANIAASLDKLESIEVSLQRHLKLASRKNADAKSSSS